MCSRLQKSGSIASTCWGRGFDVRSLGYSAEQRQLLYQRLLERVQALPGVQSASLSMNGPVITSSQISSFSIEGYTPQTGERMSTNEEIVTEDYFSTVGLRIVRGRSFVARRSRRGLEGHAHQRDDGEAVLCRAGSDWQALGV